MTTKLKQKEPRSLMKDKTAKLTPQEPIIGTGYNALQTYRAAKKGKIDRAVWYLEQTMDCAEQSEELIRGIRGRRTDEWPDGKPVMGYMDPGEGVALLHKAAQSLKDPYASHHAILEAANNVRHAHKLFEQIWLCIGGQPVTDKDFIEYAKTHPGGGGGR